LQEQTRRWLALTFFKISGKLSLVFLTTEVDLALKIEVIWQSFRIKLHKVLEVLTMRWWLLCCSVFDMWRCLFANLGSEIRVFHDLQMHRSCKSNLTGSLQRILEWYQKGTVGSKCKLVNCRCLLVEY
jgi:hypothetical protein